MYDSGLADHDRYGREECILIEVVADLVYGRYLPAWTGGMVDSFMVDHASTALFMVDSGSGMVESG